MKKAKRRKKKKSLGKLIGFIVVVFIVLGGIVGFFLWKKGNDGDSSKMIATKLDLNKVKESYHDYVKVEDGGELYQKKGSKYQKVGTMHGSIELALDPSYVVVDEYFKTLDGDYYVKYDKVVGIEGLSGVSGEYKYYRNYIPYNESVVLKDSAKLYVDGTSYYEVRSGEYPIIIKDTERYGIEFNHRLVYVGKSDVQEVIEKVNTDRGHADGLSVLNYHYTVSSTDENGERSECRQSICITDTMFDQHIKYLKDNGYYGVSMRDLELFIDGKIQLPERSISITIDDGWYVTRSIMVLEKYQMLGTLFLIGSLASPNDYVSNYLEVHSHTWDMHKLGDCPASVGRGGILCLDENTILEDLRKSRESLNQTTYFCYPFYDYNDRAIRLLQQAGFTMAFAGELRDSTVRVGQNKFKIPRYVIVNSTTMDQFISYVS